MDYEQIKTDCGRAWAVWVIWLQNKCEPQDTLCRFMAMEDANDGRFEIREFYDFFDSVSISVGIIPTRDLLDKKTKYNYVIIQANQHHIFNEDTVTLSYSNTRTEAETAAFEKAFVILEKQLNG